MFVCGCGWLLCKQGDMNSGYHVLLCCHGGPVCFWRLTFFGIFCVAGCRHAGFGPWRASVGLFVGFVLCGGIH